MKGVTLETIGGGAVAELFGVELAKVLANIADVNTDPKAKREINIKIVLKPKADRDVVDTDLKVNSKLASVNTVNTQLFVGRHSGKLIAVESDPRQGGLFDQPKPQLAVNNGDASAPGIPAGNVSTFPPAPTSTPNGGTPSN